MKKNQTPVKPTAPKLALASQTLRPLENLALVVGAKANLRTYGCV
jgi:hypothetical protein